MLKVLVITVLFMTLNQVKETNLKNQVCYSDNLIEAKKLETKTILIDDRNYENMEIYFTRYIHCKSIKILTLHFHELIGNTEDHERKNI